MAFADSFPFSTSLIEEEQLVAYQSKRSVLRDTYTDETTQLDNLIKAIRTKVYSEDEKKQLYLLILGYMDIATVVFELLQTHVPTGLPKDEELGVTAAKFDRVRKFVRLNVKGIMGILPVYSL